MSDIFSKIDIGDVVIFKFYPSINDPRGYELIVIDKSNDYADLKLDNGIFRYSKEHINEHGRLPLTQDDIRKRIWELHCRLIYRCEDGQINTSAKEIEEETNELKQLLGIAE